MTKVLETYCTICYNTETRKNGQPFRIPGEFTTVSINGDEKPVGIDLCPKHKKEILSPLTDILLKYGEKVSLEDMRFVRNLTGAEAPVPTNVATPAATTAQAAAETKPAPKAAPKKRSHKKKTSAKATSKRKSTATKTMTTKSGDIRVGNVWTCKDCGHKARTGQKMAAHNRHNHPGKSQAFAEQKRAADETAHIIEPVPQPPVAPTNDPVVDLIT